MTHRVGGGPRRDGPGRPGSATSAAASNERPQVWDARQTALDGVVLVTLVLLSALPYIGGLGFYSDDWSFLGDFVTAPHQSFGTFFQIMHDQFPERPVLSSYFAMLFRLFGAAPLGYHAVNHVVMALTAVLFYLCLKRLGLPRAVSLAWPAVFVLLPHYSTDRLWYSIGQANLSVGLYFLGLYAGLRARPVGGVGAWRGVSLVALGASVMAYEVVTPLFFLNPLLEHSVSPHEVGEARRWRATAGAMMAVAAVVGAAFVYKSGVSPRDVVANADYGVYLRWLFTSAYDMSLVQLGWQLPAKVAVILQDHVGRASLASAAGLGGVLTFALRHAARSSPIEHVARSFWLALSVGGFVFIGVGYSTFVFTSHLGFSVTGMNNRTAIAAAIGAALFYLGVWGGIVSLLPSRVRRTLFALGLASFCAGGSLLTTVVASYWVEASAAQHRLIAQLRSDAPTLAPHSRLLLDGVCSYRGPGTVFETDWDVTGMLRLHYRDATLTGDVVRSTALVEADAVLTGIYEMVVRNTYGEQLLVYDVDRRTLERLRDVATAQRYFAASRRVTRPACVPGVEGSGAPVF